MDIKIEEQDDLYCVCVKVDPYNPKEKRKVILNTSDVRRALAKQGCEVGETAQESHIHNLNGITQGTWFFKKKVLDKPAEDVIIKEEKEVEPKPTRKKRTKPSIKKKVSTED